VAIEQSLLQDLNLSLDVGIPWNYPGRGHWLKCWQAQSWRVCRRWSWLREFLAPDLRVVHRAAESSWRGGRTPSMDSSWCLSLLHLQGGGLSQFYTWWTYLCHRKSVPKLIIFLLNNLINRSISEMFWEIIFFCYFPITKPLKKNNYIKKLMTFFGTPLWVSVVKLSCVFSLWEKVFSRL